MSDYIPESYTVSAAGKVPAKVQYRFFNDQSVGFDYVGEVKEDMLVIDPLLYFSTFLGGTGDDILHVGQTDALPSGELLVTGRSVSTNYPTTAGVLQITNGGSYDGILTKLSADGSSVIFSTYFGGSGLDASYAVKVHPVNGNYYVVGGAAGSGFPMISGGYDTGFNGGSDGFVIAFNTTGTAIVSSTYYGGIAGDYCHGLDIAATGEIYVTGETEDVTPTTAGAYQTLFAGNWDGFVLIFSANLAQLQTATLFGGSGEDVPINVKIGASGDAFIAGFTRNGNLPVTPNAFDNTYGGNWDAFVARFNNTLSGLVYSTYLGTAGDDMIWSALQVDGSDQAIVAGWGASGFPTTPGAYDTGYNGGTSDIFVTKLSATGNALVASTLIGGSTADVAYGLLMDASGNFYVCGSSNGNFPVTNCQSGPYSAGSDCILAKLNNSLSVLDFAAYIGGTSNDIGYNLSMTPNGPSVTGITTSNDFPVTPNAYDISRAGGYDLFVFVYQPGGTIDISLSSVNASCYGSCDGSVTAVVTPAIGNFSYQWSNGATVASIANLCAGTYTLTVTDLFSQCSDIDSVTIIDGGIITLNEIVVHDTSCTPGQCSGSVIVTPNPGPSSGYSYSWSNGATTMQVTDLCPGNYTVTATNASGCTITETYTIVDSSDCTISPCALGISIVKVNPTCHGDCDGSMSATVANGSGNYAYVWSNGGSGAAIQNLCAGTYTIIVTDLNTNCSDTLSQTISKGSVGANVIRQNATCGQCNGSITITGNGGNGAPYTYLWSTGATTNVIDSLCPGTYTATITDKKGCTFICTNTIKNDTIGCSANCTNDFTTYTQGGWGNPGAPGQYMASNFANCTGGSVSIGDPCGYTITLTSVADVQNFLPQGGPPAVLSQNYSNPGSGNITVLAGQMLAVHFALLYDACDSGFSASVTPLKDQIYIKQNSQFYGWSIEAIHDTAMKVLAGCNSSYSPSAINSALTDINENYDGSQNHGNFVCPDGFIQTSVQHVMTNADMVLVYPNPFNNTFKIDTKGKSGLVVSIHDLAGKELRRYEEVSGIIEVTGNFESGTYLITISDPITGEQQIVRAISIH